MTPFPDVAALVTRISELFAAMGVLMLAILAWSIGRRLIERYIDEKKSREEFEEFKNEDMDDSYRLEIQDELF